MVPDYIFCLGMQRSASTLQQNIIADLLEHMGAKDHGIYQPNGKVMILGDTSHCKIYKQHVFYPEFFRPLELGKARVTYTWRDIRDIAVSCKGMARPWHWHRTTWTVSDTWFTIQRLKRLFPKYILIQRYEDMMNDFENFVKEIADFLGVIANVGSLTDKWSIQAQEKADPNITNIELLKRFGPKTSHISERKGASTWEKDLLKEDLEYIMTTHKEWFDDAGV